MKLKIIFNSNSILILPRLRATTKVTPGCDVLPVVETQVQNGLNHLFPVSYQKPPFACHRLLQDSCSTTYCVALTPPKLSAIALTIFSRCCAFAGVRNCASESAQRTLTLTVNVFIGG